MINAGTISNIAPNGGPGVIIFTGGTIDNLSTGIIEGGATNGIGISALNGQVSVTNAGSIAGNLAIHFASGGVVDNLGTGTISGTDYGVEIQASGTIINAGTIKGGADAVYFARYYSNRLIVDPGGTFVGTVKGGNPIGAAAVSALELAAGTISGTISGLGVQFLDFAQTTIDAGSHWNLGGTNTLLAGTTLTAQAGAAVDAAGSLVNNGIILLAGAALTAGTLSGTGTVGIGAGGFLDVTGSLATTESILLGLGGMLQIKNVLTNDATIANGILLGVPETVYNLAAGVIAGGFFAGASSDTLINAGYVSGGVTNGNDTNLATGTIVGGLYGVYIGRGTFTNAGSIRGTIDAVKFGSYANASFTDRLIVDPGARFSGAVDGGNTLGTTLVSTLELAAGAGVGTISSLGTKFIDFAQTTIDVGAQWAVYGASNLAAGDMLSNAGTFTIQDGTFIDAGTIVNDGLLQVVAATLTASAVIGSGQISVGTGGLFQSGSVLINDAVLEYPSSAINGVTLATGETLTNLSSGTISAPDIPVYGGLSLGQVTIINAGIISAGVPVLKGAVDGVRLQGSGGTVDNLSSGTIKSGAVGIALGKV